MAIAPATVAVIAVLIVQSTRPATSYPPPSHHEEPECQTDACRRALAGLPPLDDSEAGAQATAPSTPRAPAPTAPSVPRIVSPIVVNETTTASDASAATLAGEAVPEVLGLVEAGASSTLVIIVGQDAGAGVAILQGGLAGDASVIAWSTRPPEPPPPRVPCGAITCNPGMVCCNSSCGYCTEPGARLEGALQCSSFSCLAFPAGRTPAIQVRPAAISAAAFAPHPGERVRRRNATSSSTPSVPLVGSIPAIPAKFAAILAAALARSRRDVQLGAMPLTASYIIAPACDA